MNWVEKYIEMQLDNMTEAVFSEEPIFFNGVSVTEPGSEMKLVLYQEPFSKVVVMLVYDGKKNLYINRMILDEERGDWIVLEPRKKEEECTV